ncbi:MAG: UvrB/UvrC motif-containing protein, partial [Candidatus Acidiferrales bacterium]
ADEISTDGIQSEEELRAAIVQLETQMREAAKKFEFERAAGLRDRIRSLKQRDLSALFSAAPPLEVGANGSEAPDESPLQPAMDTPSRSEESSPKTASSHRTPKRASRA